LVVKIGYKSEKICNKKLKKGEKGMKNFMNWFTEEESGQGMVEYGLIIALIAVVLIVALQAMQGGIQNTFNAITRALAGQQQNP